MNRKQKTDLKQIIFNTLDFCGNAFQATSDFCAENDLYHNDDIEKFRFEVTQEYFNTNKK